MTDRMMRHPILATACCLLAAACSDRSSPENGEAAGAASLPDAPDAFGPTVTPFTEGLLSTPVRWRPWGPAAFAEAEKLNRPVFAFIGYSACPWCHQMRTESFEDPAVAEFINAHYVPVAVDAEAQPAINQLGMEYLLLTGKSAGWPLCLWLTPEAVPMSGGTYFPAATKAAESPSLIRVLEHTASQWERFPDHYRAQAKRDLASLTAKTATPAPSSEPAGWPDPDEVTQNLFSSLASTFDPLNGGFGGRPKFAYPLKLRFLIGHLEGGAANEFQRERAEQMLRLTLESVVASALFDPIDGGFFRYSVDSTWGAPNFEKLLVDQAALADVLFRAADLLDAPEFETRARETLAFVEAFLQTPDGGYASGLAAESMRAKNGGDPGSAALEVGAYYTWTLDELEAVLGPDDAARFASLSGAGRRGNYPLGSDPRGDLKGQNVLRSPPDPGPETAALLDRIRAAARERPRPALDQKVVLEWNAYLVSAFVTAAQTTGDPSFLERATSLAQTLWDNHAASPEPARRIVYKGVPGEAASAKDYSALVAAFLDLHGATGDAAWLEKAALLQAEQIERLWSDESKGFVEAPPSPLHFLPPVSEDDGTTPSASGLAVANLTRLAAATGDRDYRGRARQIVRGLQPGIGSGSERYFSLVSSLEALAPDG